MLYNSDCIEAMKKLDSDIVDLTITSPPYNLEIDYDQYNDAQIYSQYLTFSREWLKELYRVTKPDGRLCLNIPLDTNKFGRRPVYADLAREAAEACWKYHTTIVWNEQNISRRTCWGSWKSASAPYVIAPVEMIVVMYKEQWKKLKKGVSTIERDEFIAWTNGVWTFNGEKKKNVGNHPAAFPPELPKRCIKLFSYEDDIVMDPFMGSGTTCLVAKQLNRRYIGIELSKSYFDFAKQRIGD